MSAMRISRRTFIFAGVLGGAALVVAQLLPRGSRPAATDTLDPGATAIVAAIAPVMLEGALPAEPQARAQALSETLAAVGRAIGGLPPLAQKELDQLFTLLALPPARWSLARMTSSWQDATQEDVQHFLARLAGSRFALLRAAYDALHQLIMAAWYGNPRAWAAIGYAGPPTLG